jgi:DNA-binding XRE family transcriptional regulator
LSTIVNDKERDADMNGIQVYEARKKAGLTQKELAQALGLKNRHALVDVERGRLDPLHPDFEITLKAAIKQAEAKKEGHTDDRTA